MISIELTGVTALHAAAYNGLLEVVKILLEYEYNIK